MGQAYYRRMVVPGAPPGRRSEPTAVSPAGWLPSGWLFSTLLLACLLVFGRTASAVDYYVATTGSDANNGLSVSTPWRTVQRAMNQAIAGDTVHVRAGVYREQIDVFRGGGVAGKPVRVLGYQGEVPVIKGSDVVRGWTRYSDSIWSVPWPHNSQQVFVDFDDARPTRPLQQIGMPSSFFTSWEYNKPVGSGLSTMMPGSFFYDPAAARLYVWLADSSDPNQHVIEASVRRRLFFMGKPFIHLAGFAFRHSNATAFAKQGAAVVLSADSVIDRCDIQYTDFAGLDMGYQQPRSQALNCNVSNNGAVGIHAVAALDYRIAGVRLLNNNYRNFNPLWHAGGIKSVSRAAGTIEGSEVGFNNGSGIWFDYCNTGAPIVVRNNYVHDNGPVDSAIFFEVSKNGLIYNNVIVNNRRRGIYISGSDNTRVFNNTVVGTAGHAAIDLGGMPRSGATLTNNVVANNLVSHGSSLYDFSMMPPNGTTIYGNSSNYNDFFRAGAAAQFWWGTRYAGLASWQTTTRQDLNSISADPLYVVPATSPTALNYRQTAPSPTINRGTNVPQVTTDYTGKGRPVGPKHDIGAFEF